MNFGIGNFGIRILYDNKKQNKKRILVSMKNEFLHPIGIPKFAKPCKILSIFKMSRLVQTKKNLLFDDKT